MSQSADIRYPFLDLTEVNRRYAEEMKRAVCQVIDRGPYIGGEIVREFEGQLGERLGAEVIGVSNGLDALRLCLEGYKILGKLAEGDGVIVPANTYIASVLAISQAGLRPVLVDPDPQTMNLSAAGIECGLRQGAKAVMPVHLYGRVAWDEDIAELVKRNNLIVIEDCAQAIGAQSSVDGLFGSHQAGALGHCGAISFYPTKNLGALGDAGAVVTHDQELASAVRALANYGSTRRYHNEYIGFNCRLDPIQAAMLTAKLPDLDNANSRRIEKARIYDSDIESPLIHKPLIPEGDRECVWHQYVVSLEPDRRDWFREYMMSSGVQTDIHYPTPPHLQPCYAGLTHEPLPISERLSQSIVSLPIGDSTSADDVRAICRIINDFK